MKNILNKNLNLKGKKVLLRVDLNVPMKNGAITEISRIEKIIPTINLLLEKQAKIIIISHIGRPKGKVVKEMSLKPISEKLSSLLNREVLFNKDLISETGFSISAVIFSKALISSVICSPKYEGIYLVIPSTEECDL